MSSLGTGYSIKQSWEGHELNEPYIERKKQRDTMEEQKNESIFGLMGGLILMAAGALNWLSATGPWEVVCICIFAIGFIFFLLGIVVPAFLKYPYRAFRFWGNAAGKALFAAVLAVLYCLLVFPIGLFMRRKREEQGYHSWNKEPPKPRSMFADIKQTQPLKKTKASYFGILYSLLSVFIINRKFILIPATIILVIVGLVLFFVSSNVVTAFIYTIF